jgi:hypothetical protein
MNDTLACEKYGGGSSRGWGWVGMRLVSRRRQVIEEEEEEGRRRKVRARGSSGALGSSLVSLKMNKSSSVRTSSGRGFIQCTSSDRDKAPNASRPVIY